MKHFEEIVAAHLEVDRLISDLPPTTEPAQIPSSVPGAILDARTVNDQAYLVLLVAQLDDLATRSVEEMILAARQSDDWRYREVWLAMVPRTNRIQDIPFRTRLALLIERQRVEYQHACGLYDARNRIAHGTLDSQVSIQTAIKQLRAVASLIQEVP